MPFPAITTESPSCSCGKGKRRTGRWRFLAALAFVVVGGFARAALPESELRALISRGDLRYSQPVTRSEDGIPVGNGLMGSLVWTSLTSLNLQINRVDLQPINRDTNSFFERNTDYMGGCAFVDLNLGAAGDDIFTGANSPQHLSIYDGLLSIQGQGVTSRVVATPGDDVIAIELDDHRRLPLPLSFSLRMLRSESQYFGAEMEQMIEQHIVTVRTRNHTAASQLHIRGNRIVLTQEFREGGHFAKSAVALAITGRSARPRFTNETEVTLAAPASAGLSVVLISSAATLDPSEDIVAKTLHALDVAEAKGFAALVSDTAEWWHAFWTKGFVALHSDDGNADYIAENYHYFLYLMGSTSRGKYPPKFNGMLWNTRGDLRTWGAQHWFANLSCYYEGLYSSNHLELIDPVFSMYTGMADSLTLAARQQWGSEGLYIPETVWYDGLEKLPDDIAAEMRDLYLMRKPWAERSARFLTFAETKMPHSSRWNFFGGGSWIEGRWTPTERGFGPYGPVSHILGTTAKIAYLYWKRYEYTLDLGWLRDRAYPMIKGATEFYRNFPNLKKGDDGLYHIYHVNSNEGVLDARDTDEDLAAMRGIFATAIRAAELLEIDAPLRAQWREVLDHLAPLPTSTDSDAFRPANYDGPRVFVRARIPVANGRGFIPDGNSLPMYFFDLCNLDSPDHERLAIANATFDHSLRGEINARTPVGVLSKLAIAGSTLGRVDSTRYLIANQMRVLTQERDTSYRRGAILENRLTLREGPQAFDAQRLGRASEALQLALLNSTPPGPAEEPTIRLFAAWPTEWDATFMLRARGGFVITASQKKGRVESVEILSEAGAQCHLHNPWGEAEIGLQRDTGKIEKLHGNVLTFSTRQGERLTLYAEISH